MMLSDNRTTAIRTAATGRPPADILLRPADSQMQLIVKKKCIIGLPESAYFGILNMSKPALECGEAGRRHDTMLYMPPLARRTLLLWVASALGSTTLRPTGRLQAPDFQLHDSRGMKRTLSEFRGKVVLLNFWATWCAPCQAEIPVLNEVHREYAKHGVTVLGVAMDERGWAAVTPFLAERRVDYPVLLGNPAVARLYGGLEVLPYTLFLDRDGRVVADYSAVLTRTHLRKVVETLLSESAQSR
jgi:thiol-disulfide isomerase/thioredoxin